MRPLEGACEQPMRMRWHAGKEVLMQQCSALQVNPAIEEAELKAPRAPANGAAAAKLNDL